MKLESKIKLHNNFKVCVFDQGKEQTYKAENVVLNQFYSRMFSSNNGIDKIFVGEGGNTP